MLVKPRPDTVGGAMLILARLAAVDLGVPDFGLV